MTEECIEGSTKGRNRCRTTVLNKASYQRRESTKNVDKSDHNAGTTNIILDDQKSARAFGRRVDELDYDRPYFLMFNALSGETLC